MYFLLPPSEGKAPVVGDLPFSGPSPASVADTEALLKHLRKLKAGERATFYGLRDKEKTDAAHALNLDALIAPGLPALERYTGVVYTYLDYKSLRAKAAARKKLLIVSALFGLIPGGTSIPNYKLSMNPWLVRYWRGRNNERFAALAGKTPVVDLLSQSYRKALDAPGAVSVDFRVQGGKKAAGHFGKAIKGRFVRWAIENNVKSIADFHAFTEDGYRFDGQNFIQE